MARQGLMDDSGYNFFDVSDCANYESCRENAYNDGYEKGRADAFKNTELFREIFLEDLINQSVDREEAIMYTNICTMAWSKFIEQIKEKNNE